MIHLHLPSKFHHFPSTSRGASESEKEERTWQLAAKVAAAAWEACERTLAQRVPCFLCGPWSMVVPGIFVGKVLFLGDFVGHVTCLF